MTDVVPHYSDDDDGSESESSSTSQSIVHSHEKETPKSPPIQKPQNNQIPNANNIQSSHKKHYANDEDESESSSTSQSIYHGDEKETPQSPLPIQNEQIIQIPNVDNVHAQNYSDGDDDDCGYFPSQQRQASVASNNGPQMNEFHQTEQGFVSSGSSSSCQIIENKLDNEYDTDSPSESDMDINLEGLTPAGPPVQKLNVPKNRKSCSKCTFFNYMNAKKCKQCETPFPKKPQKQNKPQKKEKIVKNNNNNKKKRKRRRKPKYWQCPNCNNRNKKITKQCQVCGQVNVSPFEWKCEVCTVINHCHFKKCQTCHEQRKLPPNTWQCFDCFHYNSNAPIRCRQCKKPNPSHVKKVKKRKQIIKQKNDGKKLSPLRHGINAPVINSNLSQSNYANGNNEKWIVQKNKRKRSPSKQQQEKWSQHVAKYNKKMPNYHSPKQQQQQQRVFRPNANQNRQNLRPYSYEQFPQHPIPYEINSIHEHSQPSPVRSNRSSQRQRRNVQPPHQSQSFQPSPVRSHRSHQSQRRNIEPSKPRMERPNKIKVIIYDFDQTLSVKHLSNLLKQKDTENNGQFYVRNHMKKNDFFEIFGGAQRINRLKKHFELLRQNGIKFSILSYLEVGIIRYTLEQIDLYKFFVDSTILSGDMDILYNNEMNGPQIKKYCIQQTFLQSNEYCASQILYVDDDGQSTNCVKQICKTFIINPRNGMNDVHMADIENMTMPNSNSMNSRVSSPNKRHLFHPPQPQNYKKKIEENDQKMDQKVEKRIGKNELIKFVIYGFDQCLTAENLSNKMQQRMIENKEIGEMEHLKRISGGRLSQIFGGENRLKKLRNHFEKLKKNKIKFAIISSFSSTKVIEKVLERVKIPNYAKIVGYDQLKNKKCAVWIQQRVKGKLLLKKDQIIFVEHDVNNLYEAEHHSICKTLRVEEKDGMSKKHLMLIDKMCGINAKKKDALFQVGDIVYKKGRRCTIEELKGDFCTIRMKDGRVKYTKIHKLSAKR